MPFRSKIGHILYWTVLLKFMIKIIGRNIIYKYIYENQTLNMTSIA